MSAAVPELATALRLRSLAFATMRRFFRQRGFVEVDAPLLLPGVPIESFVEVFRCDLKRQAGQEDRFLPPSPEAGLKRALALLQADCFELGHAFRNGEEEGTQHRAHFRMLEWYRVDADYRDIMDDTVQLFRALADCFAQQDIAPLAAPSVDYHAPWEEITVQQALERYAGLRLRGPADLPLLAQAVRQRGLGDPASWQDAFCILLAVEVEPHLGRGHPSLLCDYPAGLAAQARSKPDEPWLAEQFEVWVDGVELGNSYSELTDPAEQARRFQVEAQRLAAGGRRAPPSDPAYLQALAHLPRRCAGGSLGVDRVLMRFLGATDIRQVRLA